MGAPEMWILALVLPLTGVSDLGQSNSPPHKVVDDADCLGEMLGDL